MNSDELLEYLLKQDVLTVKGGDQIVLSKTFQEAIDEASESSSAVQFDGDGEGEMSGEKYDLFTAVSDRSEELLPTLYAIDEYLPDVSADVASRVLLAVDQIRYPPEHTSGVPDGFLPVRGDRVPLYTDLFSRTIVYVWQEDCDPCDAASQAFEEIFDASPQELVPFAVHGPSWVDEMRDMYDVLGAPTALFVRDGRVDARLLGDQVHQAAESEVEMLR